MLAVFIPWFTSAFWPEKIIIKQPWRLIQYIAVVLWEILAANVIVAKLILRSADKLQPGFVRYPLQLRSPVGISLLANTISLTPGTVSCDLSEDGQFLLIHALHMTDPDKTIAEIKQKFEQPLQEIFVAC
ncbi:Na(+) H(+) antiporter subunit E [Methylophaga frappieri]|uniref:Na(+) H(+) antiporter subunit E n=2 Tax=Methylophaga frappieri (strain ATCC BAA-2434 / DSM 25690 / JAM7) TaxID=754477 RepID=I1YH78_METFJ|nr:Na(+) H(+) antiporter subunit E [Methylophaga frappieri]